MWDKGLPGTAINKARLKLKQSRHRSSGLKAQEVLSFLFGCLVFFLGTRLIYTIVRDL